ncbi:MAG TPA: Uma2 family endonuclease [Gemmataceae bacterium]|jgi:Uma2 family endonuclease|nr:Uma2 family endonuclease [Gemmataceae bacterium]
MTPRTTKSAHQAGPYTYEDFCAMVREDQKADLINGVIYVASPENTDANELFGWLFVVISLFAEARELGQVYGSRAALRLDGKNGPEPDIAFVLKAHLHRVHRSHIDGPCDLAVEIVSPDSVGRDYESKRRLYQEAGVAEYWIVDEIEEKVTLLRLDDKGKYREVRPRKGELHSTVLPGFWIRPEWLWQNPRPKKTQVLAEILGRLG